MTLNQFSLALTGVAIASFAAGITAGEYFGSALFAIAGAFLLPATSLMFFGRSIGRAWWSVNRNEAQRSYFQAEAKQSLRFVNWMTAGLSLVAGIAGFLENNIYEGTFAGMMLAMTLFGFTRLRDVAARIHP